MKGTLTDRYLGESHINTSKRWIKVAKKLKIMEQSVHIWDPFHAGGAYFSFNFDSYCVCIVTDLRYFIFIE